MSAAGSLVEMQQSATALRNSAKQFAAPWDSMPPNGRPFFSTGSIPSPNYGAANQAVVCQFKAPSKCYAALKLILLNFIGSGFVVGSGNVIWTLDVNIPLSTTPGYVSGGYNLQDYGQITLPLGSVVNGPWPISGAVVFADQDILRIKVQTVATVGQGAPNFVIGVLEGWIWPMGIGYEVGI